MYDVHVMDHLLPGQDLSSHLRGVLATQAVLEGMGVGRAGSTPLAATLQWMARDGE